MHVPQTAALLHAKAHRTNQVMLELGPAERRRALANDVADGAAKRALQLHPVLPHEVMQDTNLGWHKARVKSLQMPTIS